MTYRFKLKKSWIVLLVLVVLSICGCATQTPVTTDQPEEVLEETPTTQIEDKTAVPTSTQAIPVILLIIDPEADPFLVEQTQSALEMLIADGEQTLVRDTGIPPEQDMNNVEIVVGVGPELGLASLAASAPQTYFVSIGDPVVEPSPNMSVIGDPLIDQRYQSFLAGYLAALVSSDYKVAGLVPSEGDLSSIMLDAFRIGTRFYCGICKPLYPPYNSFPQSESLPVENSSDGFQPVVDALAANSVEVLYLQGELQSQQILTYLADAGIMVVSDQSPDVIRNNWVGTVVVDPGPALVTLWPDLIEGAEGVRKASSIALIDTETGLLTEGRRHVFDQMLADLQAGLVLPQSVP